MDLGSCNPLTTAVPSVGDGDGGDIISVQQIHSPPGVGLRVCVGTGATHVICDTLPVYGVAGTSQIAILGRLSS